MNRKEIKTNKLSTKFQDLKIPFNPKVKDDIKLLEFEKGKNIEQTQNWNKNCNFLITNQENLSKKHYQHILIYDLILKHNYTTVMQLPCLEKIVLNTTSKKYINDKKLILLTLATLELISGQKPQLTYAQKSIANFKIRQHQLIGCKVILCNNLMYNFLDKLSKIIFPRIRDYSKKKLSKQRNSNHLPILYNKQDKSFFFSKKRTTHNFGFQNLMIFPELENNFELMDSFNGMNLTFVLSNSNKKSTLLVMSGFQMPFSKRI
uniref:50S ribosomal protein L5 n=1 Tax=Chlorella sp. ATCC 30562 TaxID=2025116 RepID=A0A2I4S736_9CHLO|nr:50S ribosomal protein L5 [Chlorella sp. ATCC 30562]